MLWHVPLPSLTIIHCAGDRIYWRSYSEGNIFTIEYAASDGSDRRMLVRYQTVEDEEYHGLIVVKKKVFFAAGSKHGYDTIIIC